MKHTQRWRRAAVDDVTTGMMLVAMETDDVDRDVITVRCLTLTVHTVVKHSQSVSK